MDSSANALTIPHIVIMGVCGSGKTTVAGILADRIGLEVAEADDFHPRANVEKMAAGTPLTDEDRWPWLESLRAWMDEKAAVNQAAIITCSALKRSYRDLLRQCHYPVVFVHLDGSYELLSQRLAARTNHFMPPGLLDSQLDTLERLESDEVGYVLDIGPTPQQITTEIMEAMGLDSDANAATAPVRAADPGTSSQPSPSDESANSFASARADIGVYGLGVMGTSLARNLARHGFTVAVYNVEPEVTEAFTANYSAEGDFCACRSVAEFAAILRTPRVAAMMVTAGQVTDLVTDQLADAFDAGDIIIDMGNSFFADTRRREATLRERGLHFVGCGTSGGQEGALNGPSLMIGGSRQSYERLEPMFTAIAARTPAGTACSAHVGTDGAGHFVKMVHNGIEYADMQLIAEAYALLSDAGYSATQAARVFQQWGEGELSSYLIDITAQILAHVDEATGRPFVEVVDDAAGNKGTGIWTVQQAASLGVAATGIAEATLARMLSAAKASRAAVREALGPVNLLPSPSSDADREAFAEDVRRALYSAKVVAYAQGLDVILEGAREYQWQVDIAQVVQIWRAGCIIRARFLDDVSGAYRDNPELASLLAAPVFARSLKDYEPAWRRVATHAIARAVPTPALTATLQYVQGMRTEALPTALIQAQRDFFGAHTYRRRDREGVFHTHWEAEARSEEYL